MNIIGHLDHVVQRTEEKLPQRICLRIGRKSRRDTDRSVIGAQRNWEVNSIQEANKKHESRSSFRNEESLGIGFCN